MADIETITWVDPSQTEQVITSQSWIKVAG